MSDAKTAAGSNVRPGAIWTPRRGRGYPKVITHLGKNGVVYAARYPKRAGTLSFCFNAQAWRRWVAEYAACWTGDVE